MQTDASLFEISGILFQTDPEGLKPVFAEHGRKRPPPWTLTAHGFFLAPLP